MHNISNIHKATGDASTASTNASNDGDNEVSGDRSSNTRSAVEVAANCRKRPGSTLVLSSAVLYKGKLYCRLDDNKEPQAIIAEVELRSTWHKGNDNIPALPLVTGDIAIADLHGHNCSTVRGWSAIIGMVYVTLEYAQMGHFVYNTAAPYFDALATAFTGGKTHASQQPIRLQQPRLPTSGISVFLYPDSPAASSMSSDPFAPAKLLPLVETVMAAFGTAAVYSAPALLDSSHDEALCFENLFAGMSGAQLDHYNTAAETTNRPAGWRSFKAYLGDQLHAIPMPRCRRNATNIVVLQRKGSRALLNIEEIADVARAVFSVHSLTKVQVVVFDDMPFPAQLQLMSVTDVLIGVDGTGLFNANFMSEGSTVIRIKPYMLDRLLPGKSDNFIAIWEALGIRHLEWSSNDISTTTPSVSLQELEDAVDNAHHLPYLAKFKIALNQGTRVAMETFGLLLEQAAKSASAASRC